MKDGRCTLIELGELKQVTEGIILGKTLKGKWPASLFVFFLKQELVSWNER